MADESWQRVTDKVGAADPALNVGQRICLVANELLLAKTASLALVIDNAYSPVASADELAELLDDEQFALGDGPTFDARESPSPVILDDTHARRTAERWPAFCPIAEKHGIHGAFAFPLRIGDAYLGVLTAYRDRAGEPSAGQYSDGLILASLGTAAIISREAGVGTEPGPALFEPGLYDQSALQVAAGMVAESLNVSIVAALVRIRARAFADDQPVSKTAQLIVTRQLVLDP